MTGPDPAEYGWWLASRAAGLVALLCVAVSVGIGLAMAGRVATRPGLAAALLALHRQTALAGLVAIAVHGIALLGDGFLDPGLVGIAVPFVIDHARVWTGLGVTAGWLAAALGLSYWARGWIGVRRWRVLHRATLVVYLLGVAHTLGAGTDASEPWLLLLVLATAAPILFLFVMRLLPAGAPREDAGAPWPGFRTLRVAEVIPESATVTSFALEDSTGAPLPPFVPGQSVAVRAQLPGTVLTTRSYSLSGAPDGRRWRISVRREADGALSRHLHAAVRPGLKLDVAGPRGTFVLEPDAHTPLALLSAGIGVTPLLAMLHALAAAGSRRELWWIHGARCAAEHPFRAEVEALLAGLPRAHSHVRYSRPVPGDAGHDATGRLDAPAVLALGVPRDAQVYVCGPPDWLDALTVGLSAAGVQDVRSERFANPRPPVVAFARSKVTVPWEGRLTSLLDLAEANGVAAPAACRAGVCGTCRTTVTSGRVEHAPDPAEPPGDGAALLCCARPVGDVVLEA